MPRITKVLQNLISTEKTTKAKEGQNVYVFKVLGSASQGLVAKEVAQNYKVEVENVNLMIVPGKKRRLRKTQRFTRTPKWKKALVQLKEGQKIEEVKDSKISKEVKESKNTKDTKDAKDIKKDQTVKTDQDKEESK